MDLIKVILESNFSRRYHCDCDVQIIVCKYKHHETMQSRKKDLVKMPDETGTKVSIVSTNDLNCMLRCFQRSCNNHRYFAGVCSKIILLVSQGSSWLHVGTDQPFKSISIGAASQVWAIAKDGSAFYRGSVSSQSPAGQWEELWYSASFMPLLHNNLTKHKDLLTNEKS